GRRNGGAVGHRDPRRRVDFAVGDGQVVVVRLDRRRRRGRGVEGQAGAVEDGAGPQLDLAVGVGDGGPGVGGEVQDPDQGAADLTVVVELPAAGGRGGQPDVVTPERRPVQPNRGLAGRGRSGRGARAVRG